MSRVLLFGSAGYLGGHVRRALAGDARISTLTCTDIEQYDLVAGGMADLVDLVRDAAPDAVVMCAGALGGTGYELVLANTAATAKLIDAVAAAAPGARLVRLGSAAEYGPVPHGHRTTEDDPTAPVGAYGVSHLAATTLLRLAGEEGRVDGVALRVFNPIGPGGKGGNLLARASQLIAEALETGAGHITMGPLGAYRDFVDVRDVASAVLAAVVTPRLRHRIFNVGSGQAVASRYVVELLAQAADFHGEIREAGGGSQRSAAVDWACADITRAAADLGWTPVHGLAASTKAIWTAAH